MGVSKGHEFPAQHNDVFPNQLLMLSQVTQVIKYNPDRTAVPEQAIDYDPKTGKGTMLPLWKVTVSDPSEEKGKRASFEVIFRAPVQPVPSTEEIAPNTGIRFIELEGLTCEPRVMGQGEFKYLGYIYRATGIKGDNSGSKMPPADVPASRPTRADKAVA
ncbi:hypothetical protein [Nocardia sp. NPDC059239]|uniref:hypothetical protein n=1 Tax=unclassified Nocardia TaxID=2637762 RepID=UPI003683925C